LGLERALDNQDIVIPNWVGSFFQNSADRLAERGGSSLRVLTPCFLAARIWRNILIGSPGIGGSV
jgi:hypothetical protein